MSREWNIVSQIGKPLIRRMGHAWWVYGPDGEYGLFPTMSSAFLWASANWPGATI